jgi:integrase/transcription elongation factor Elf1
MNKRKHPAISIHPTLQGHLEVNWQRDYIEKFHCPHCDIGSLNALSHSKLSPYKLTLRCNSCRKTIYLTCPIFGTNRKKLPISTHQTLDGTLTVNWKQEYKGEFICPNCNHRGLYHFIDKPSYSYKLNLECKSCKNIIYLTCQVQARIFNYRPNIECPNPVCTKIGHDGQKGWVYQTSQKYQYYKCYFCSTYFDYTSTHSNSWVGSQLESKVYPFRFDDDIWDLRHFYEKPSPKTMNFQTIQPEWYQLHIKQYLYYLLKSRKYSSADGFRVPVRALRHFGQVLKQRGIQQSANITREVILSYLDTCNTFSSDTISHKLSHVKSFLEWLGLDASHLIRSRDYPKNRINDVDWLDEETRTKIKQLLNKIFAPIARQYLVQEYTAARVGDICKLDFNCLVEENGNWYIKFYQSKSQRWHQLPINRETRRIIEEQQQWIRQTFGMEYSYLFCHFRNIKQESYPDFLTIKALHKPPTVNADKNPMVRIIRMLIEQENIRDANGKKPNFLGKITRSSRLQEVRVKHGLEAAQLYADHVSRSTTYQHYAPPSQEQIAQVDLPFQALLMNPDNRFLPWQSLPESLLKNPKAHELDMEIAPRLIVYGHCALDPKIPCPVNLFPKCYGCNSFRPSTSKLPLYERQYVGEQERMQQAKEAEAELAYEEAKTTIEVMDKWLPELRKLANE